jgi:hypothetical protein
VEKSGVKKDNEESEDIKESKENKDNEESEEGDTYAMISGIPDPPA